MRQKVNTLEFFGAWTLFGAEIEDLVAHSEGSNITSDHVTAAMMVAIEPRSIEVAMSNRRGKELAIVFASAMATNPDLILKIIHAVRTQWKEPKSISARIRKFMASTPMVPVGNKRLVQSTLQDKEIARMIGKTTSAQNVKDARSLWRKPKRQDLLHSWELHKALKFLKENNGLNFPL